MILDDHAYNALQKISSETKMDCWFCLDQDEDGNDVLLDLETDEYIPLEEGLKDLCEGMVDPPEDEFYRLTEEELSAFRELVEKLGLTSALMS